MDNNIQEVIAVFTAKRSQPFGFRLTAKDGQGSFFVKMFDPDYDWGRGFGATPWEGEYHNPLHYLYGKHYHIEEVSW